MITTVDLFQKFKDFIENGNLNYDYDDCEIRFATPSIGLEIGYYSLSKTDLLVGGTKRGHLIKHPKKPFDGYVYYFKDKQLVLAKRVIDSNDRSVTFLKHENNYCFGYTFDILNQIVPARCFVYELDRDNIVAFKTFSGYPLKEKWPDDIIREEQYEYKKCNLYSIAERICLYDFSVESERLISETVYDYFSGKYWCSSKSMDNTSK